MPAWVSSKRHQALVKALVAARSDAGLTQRELATRLGQQPSFVAKIETNERNVTALNLLSWTEALGIDPGPLLAKVAEIKDS